MTPLDHAMPNPAPTAPAPPSRPTGLYMSLWFPYLATDRLRRAGVRRAGVRLSEGGFENRALVTTRSQGAGVFVVAVDRLGATSGLVPGMTLASARAILPELVTAPSDPVADAALLDRLAGWCDRYSPLVGMAGGDRLVLDVRGCAHLFGGLPDMLNDALVALGRIGFAVRGAVAASPAAAAALALYDRQGAAVVAERKALADALSSLPVAALRLAEPALDADALEGLQRVGLRRLGDLYSLPRAALAARFGAASASALDRLLGHRDQPVTPRRPIAPYRVRLAFPDPIGLRGDIDAAVERLVHRMAQRLEGDAMGCRRLVLTACLADGSSQEFGIGTNRPSRAPKVLLRLLNGKLDAIEPGFGIDCLILSAPVVEPFASGQAEDALFQSDAPEGEGGTEEALASLCDRLTNRLGAEAVFRLAPVDSRLPDAAQIRRNPVKSDTKSQTWPRRIRRPTRLLDQPIPLTPLAAPGPGEPLLEFRLKGRHHRIRIALGPERIAPDWWRKDAAWAAGTRDYWQVEDEAGQGFWIYRDGVRDGMTDPAAARAQHWFLQGLW